MEEPSGRSKGILLSRSSRYSYYLSSYFLPEFINVPIYDFFFHISDIYDCVSFFSCAAKFYFISLQLPPVPAQARTYLSMRPNNSIPSLPRSTSLFSLSLTYLFLTSVSLTLSLSFPHSLCLSLFFPLFSTVLFFIIFRFQRLWYCRVQLSRRSAEGYDRIE